MVVQQTLEWIKQNATAVQAALTFFGSAVAIGIALYQQRAISRREMRFRALQASAISEVLSLEFIELVVTIAAARLILERKAPEGETLTDAQILERTVIALPEGVGRLLDQIHLLGPTRTHLLLRIISGVRIYNSTSTVQKRWERSEDFSENLKALSRELRNTPPSDFRR
jgi:hypothetical protein